MTDQELLHGHLKLIFWDFNDDGTIYLERLTVSETEAIERMAEDMGVGTDEIGVESIWMRWIETEHGSVIEGLEPPCWVVCPEYADASIPFWRVSSPKIGGGKSEGAV